MSAPSISLTNGMGWTVWYIQKSWLSAHQTLYLLHYELEVLQSQTSLASLTFSGFSRMTAPQHDIYFTIHNYIQYYLQEIDKSSILLAGEETRSLFLFLNININSEHTLLYDYINMNVNVTHSCSCGCVQWHFSVVLLDWKSSECWYNIWNSVFCQVN